MNLIPADKVEILIVIDNYADSMLEPAPGVKRREIANEGFLPTDTVLAEHGVCMLVTAWKDDKKVGVIFDTGFSPVAAPRNIEFLNEDLSHVQAIAISHAHEDHIGATSQLLKMSGNPPLHVHPALLGHPRPLGRHREDPPRARLPRHRRGDLAGQEGAFGSWGLGRGRRLARLRDRRAGSGGFAPVSSGGQLTPRPRGPGAFPRSHEDSTGATGENCTAKRC